MAMFASAVTVCIFSSYLSLLDLLEEVLSETLGFTTPFVISAVATNLNDGMFCPHMGHPLMAKQT